MEGGVVVLLTECLLLARAGIWNLFTVLVGAHLLFVEDTVGSLTSTNSCQHMGLSGYNAHPRDGTHTDESPWL